MTEPVVFHHGREGGGGGHDEVRPSASMACWAALIKGGVRRALACLVIRLLARRKLCRVRSCGLRLQVREPSCALRKEPANHLEYFGRFRAAGPRLGRSVEIRQYESALVEIVGDLQVRVVEYACGLAEKEVTVRGEPAQAGRHEF